MINHTLPPVSEDKKPLLNHFLKFKSNPYEFIKNQREKLGGILNSFAIVKECVINSIPIIVGA